MNGLTDRTPSPPGYQSPYGQVAGLADRLAKWPKALGSHGYPWVGTGIIKDLELAAMILNRREFLEKLRLSDDPEAQRFADELLEDCDELETVTDAAARVGGLPDEKHELPAVETIEKLDERAQDYERVRHALVELGVLDASDHETPVADLIRAVMA